MKKEEDYKNSDVTRSLERQRRKKPSYGEREDISCAERTVKNLFPYSPIHLLPSKKVAFTLAEVLITLGIIGVVAAITMSVLVSKINEIVMINRLKSTYSIILNAINLRKTEIGASDYSDVFPSTGRRGADDLDGLLKHMKYVEICEWSSLGCGGRYIIKYPQAENDGYGKNKYINAGNKYRAVLANGTLIWLINRNTDGTCQYTYSRCPRDENGNYIDGECTYYNVNQCAEIFFDLDGAKGKNQFGYDCFAFTVKQNTFSQHSGYGSIDTTIRTGKLNYKNYEAGGDFTK